MKKYFMIVILLLSMLFSVSCGGLHRIASLKATSMYPSQLFEIPFRYAKGYSAGGAHTTFETKENIQDIYNRLVTLYSSNNDITINMYTSAIWIRVGDGIHLPNQYIIMQYESDKFIFRSMVLEVYDNNSMTGQMSVQIPFPYFLIEDTTEFPMYVFTNKDYFIGFDEHELYNYYITTTNKEIYINNNIVIQKIALRGFEATVEMEVKENIDGYVLSVNVDFLRVD